MYCRTRKRTAAMLLAANCMVTGILFPETTAYANYINTNRDTLLPEEAMEIVEQSVEEYEKLYETDSAVYYFRDDRDIIAVFDKESGYLWKTGLDAEAAKKLKAKALSASTEEDFKELENTPIEDNMNEIYTDMANSLITVEYRSLDSIDALKKASSASSASESTLQKVTENQYCLDVDFKEIDLQMKVYITFGEKQISYQIPYDQMSGEGRYCMTSLYITPFLGSSGGQVLKFDKETGGYDITEKKETPSGYAFVPDGSGALIRFRDNNVAFQEYVGDVYGEDISQGEYYYESLTDAVPLKNPVMPVFGVAYGNDQAAFVAYADEGDEYMSIQCTPEENMTYYTWTCAKFNYNLKYHQVYNKAGDGYFSLMEEPNAFDISMTYEFLSGDGSGSTPAADYVGMALAYRQHLMEEGVLSEQLKGNGEEIPIRLDFMMSDAKSSVVGMENVVSTTIDDVTEILTDVMKHGIININAGLWGWQKKGESVAKPYTRKYSSRIGTKKEFKELIASFGEQGVDISYGNDYVTINKEMMNYYGNAVAHVNSWYAYQDKSVLLPTTAPVSQFGYAKPAKSAEWIKKQYQGQKETVTSMTVKGIGSVLTGDYANAGHTTVSDAIALYQDTLQELGDVKLNLTNPGMYLWKYTDRYLQAPVGHSQYIFETDAVPFLQIVLNGTMEVYAPYANFSFYTQADILKMIDYNLFPSFVLTKEPSYLLADTVSADLYSTEYTLYRELIGTVYREVNEVLSQVSGYEWTNRIVEKDGVIVNVYTKGTEEKKVIINYTQDTQTIDGVKVDALSAVAVQGGNGAD